ncbi:Gp138 family membrane-puncturing spike protein [Lelliottia sp. V89_10]|uniref:Gp138 family membrane-puncturing spike protein n=1 Tax=Lelliottia wanjuensis TaxID=3050585 RepID=UPI00249E1B76|nr:MULTISPECIES: Gp138 family membrane-puncturing spike protein [unclassified Lelliottia]MDI3361139.1 Gp138 family membrane-puncturing spike protein [Lelliottia sp. V89_13]MDK9551238.1 Gp138 family membrane-puncturing spike protein [Lelliottia sp. V89_5]MDK9597490.1 Gp138 family membrane-puncturing spike protein [Lelliottia sp. V89_10]
MMNLFTNRPQDTSSEANAQQFLMHQFLMGKAFITLAIVTAVNDSGEVVSIKPMVDGFTGGGDRIPSGVISGVPVWRLQRGASAVIMPPVVGDIGLIAICDRDITAVKATKDAALPGSNRTHSYSDAIYLGGVLNAEPSQYVKFSNDGIDIVSPLLVNVNGNVVSINAESRAEINAPQILLNGQVGQGEGSYAGTAHFKNKVTSDVDFQAGDISLVGHRTSGVQTGGGTSGTPVP